MGATSWTPYPKWEPRYSLSLPHILKTPIIIYNHMICLCLAYFVTPNVRVPSTSHCVQCRAGVLPVSAGKREGRTEGELWISICGTDWEVSSMETVWTLHQELKIRRGLLCLGRSMWKKARRGGVHSLPYSVHSPRVYVCLVPRSSPSPTTSFHVPHPYQGPSWECKNMGPLHIASPSLHTWHSSRVYGISQQNTNPT